MPKPAGNEMVTVGRLLNYLKTLPADMPIVMSSDEEGNSYSVLTDFGIGGLNQAEGLGIVGLPKGCKHVLTIYPS